VVGHVQWYRWARSLKQPPAIYLIGLWQADLPRLPPPTEWRRRTRADAAPTAATAGRHERHRLRSLRLWVRRVVLGCLPAPPLFARGWRDFAPGSPTAAFATPSTLLALPDEVLMVILAHLDLVSLYRLGGTCTRLYAVCRDPAAIAASARQPITFEQARRRSANADARRRPG